METRNSHGLDQFCAAIQDETGLSILDLAGANQDTVMFITSLGHRLYSDDILRTLDAVYGKDDPDYRDPILMSKFLEQTLDFPDGQFDGALVWDTLQFLPPQLLQIAVERLHRILRPHSGMLALFHAEEKHDLVPACSYRISNAKTIMVIPRGTRKPAQHFNNRNLEKLFQDFASVKFFLTRDHLREVIVRR